MKDILKLKLKGFYTPIATLFLYGLIFLRNEKHYFCNVALFTACYIISRGNSINYVALHHFCWKGTLLSHRYRRHLCMIAIYFLHPPSLLVYVQI